MSGSTAVTVILLIGAEGDAPPVAVLGSESSPYLQLVDGAAVEVRVVSLGTSRTVAGAGIHLRLDDGRPSRVDRFLDAVGVSALRDRLEGFPIGRLLNTLGPLDPSRVFWRALTRHPEALRLLRTSDVAIATDLETTKAAWLAVHRGWVGRAFYDRRALAVAGDAAA